MALAEGLGAVPDVGELVGIGLVLQVVPEQHGLVLEGLGADAAALDKLLARQCIRVVDDNDEQVDAVLARALLERRELDGIAEEGARSIDAHAVEAGVAGAAEVAVQPVQPRSAEELAVEAADVVAADHEEPPSIRQHEMLAVGRESQRRNRRGRQRDGDLLMGGVAFGALLRQVARCDGGEKVLQACQEGRRPVELGRGDPRKQPASALVAPAVVHEGRGRPGSHAAVTVLRLEKRYKLRSIPEGEADGRETLDAAGVRPCAGCKVLTGIGRDPHCVAEDVGLVVIEADRVWRGEVAERRAEIVLRGADFVDLDDVVAIEMVRETGGEAEADLARVVEVQAVAGTSATRGRAVLEVGETRGLDDVPPPLSREVERRHPARAVGLVDLDHYLGRAGWASSVQAEKVVGLRDRRRHRRGIRVPLPLAEVPELQPQALPLLTRRKHGARRMLGLVRAALPRREVAVVEGQQGRVSGHGLQQVGELGAVAPPPARPADRRRIGLPAEEHEMTAGLKEARHVGTREAGEDRAVGQDQAVLRLALEDRGVGELIGREPGDRRARGGQPSCTRRTKGLSSPGMSSSRTATRRRAGS